MASKQPIVKQTAWLSLIPQLLILGVCIFLASLTGTQNPAIMGALGYIVASVLLRKKVTLHHRSGMTHFRNEEFSSALNSFQQSYDFFSLNRWIDDWRYITLLSSSRISYREMDLLNMAYCYGQLGEGDKARKFYERTLTEFPNSAMAKAAINMLDSVTPNKTQI